MYILSILYISSSEELPNDVYTFVILSFSFTCLGVVEFGVLGSNNLMVSLERGRLQDVEIQEELLQFVRNLKFIGNQMFAGNQ
jgi:hypothetical protein